MAPPSTPHPALIFPLGKHGYIFDGILIFGAQDSKYISDCFECYF